MSVVVNLCVCLYVCKSMEREVEAFMKLQYILDILIISQIFCYCMFIGGNLC